MNETLALNKWHRIILSSKNAEELSFHLWDIPNVVGVQILDNETLACTYNCSDSYTLEKLSPLFKEAGFEIKEISQIQDINWVQKCEEIWQPIQIGEFLLLPCLSDEENNTTVDSTTLKIIPGLGFGTGHHSSTQIALEYLCQLKRDLIHPKTILDLGTGSGILAIAARKLWNSNVIGVDTDCDALSNASENIALNGFENKITLKHGEIKLVNSRFDLIIANIYAEVLISLVEDFNRRIEQGGHLILSGIMPELKGQVISSYINSEWKMIIETEQDNWCGLLFKKL